MTQLELVRAVLAYYGGDAAKWCQGHSAQTAAGGPCSPTSKIAAACCLLGAAERVGGLGMALADALRLTEATADWNDAYGRTFAEVEQRLREAETRLANEERANAG